MKKKHIIQANNSSRLFQTRTGVSRTPSKHVHFSVQNYFIHKYYRMCHSLELKYILKKTFPTLKMQMEGRENSFKRNSNKPLSNTKRRFSSFEILRSSDSSSMQSVNVVLRWSTDIFAELKTIMKARTENKDCAFLNWFILKVSRFQSQT